MRLGDLDALKEKFAEYGETAKFTQGACQRLIDNAPTVKFSLMPADETKEDAYKRGYEKGKIAGILKANTRPQGEWIPKHLWDNKYIWVCSECGNRNRHGITVEKACWKCGADMRGKEE